MPEKIPLARCVKPNSRLSIRTGITANPSIGRPSSSTLAREQLFSALSLNLIGIRLLYDNYGDSMSCVQTIRLFSSRFFRSRDPIHSQRARAESLVCCPPFLLFRALFHSCRNKSFICHAYQEYPGGTLAASHS